MQVLVLNVSYMPINRVPWQDALCDVFTGRAEVVEEYDNWVVHSSTMCIPVPSVIRFISTAANNVFRRGVKFNRNNVWMRDKGRCQYCNRQVSRAEFTYDHVRPQSQGGRTRWENIVVACTPCNQRKRDRSPEEVGMRLIREPYRPKFLPGVSFPVFQWDDDMPPSWKDYLGSVRYWHSELGD